ncbi:glycosyltransferase [Ligilactobacillus salivarius]|uniref:glycosyltransferase n=1 Tax=Ligilactobacillus salivarius TaxID=1624 RepID=UPI0009DA4F2B|nr:glycosyltransferase [Ligilactobacillus salivarius]OQQ79463.1 UDP-D-galactose--(glucosyl)lipopolysaccharide-1,6-D-galactosyltransferase [Ligilactobacillus salivarius]
MKKLNFLCSELSGTGGTETILIKVLNHLIDNYEVTLTLSNIPEKREWLDKIDRKVKINMFKGNNNISKLLFILKLFLFEKNTDYISLSPKMILLGSKIKKIFNKNYQIISWFHLSLANQDVFDTDHTLPCADGHLAISNVNRRELLNMGVTEERIRLIYNPTEKNEILPQNCNNEMRIFYAGRIVLGTPKNLRELLNGINNIDNVYLDIYGGGPDLEKGKELANNLGITDRIKWHGWTSKLWEEITERPDALIMTSNSEGFPMIMLEAISRGIPVITSNFDGYDSIIKEGINGYSYELGNIESMKEAIEKLRENKLSPEKVKDSISRFYSDSYFENLDEAIEYFVN